MFLSQGQYMEFQSQELEGMVSEMPNMERNNHVAEKEKAKT